MKAPNKGNHPCPVLLEDGGDYLSDCSLTLECVGEPVKIGDGFTESMEYSLSANLNCAPLNHLVDEGKAKIVLMVEQATQRKAYDYQKNFVLSLRPYEFKLGENVEITPIVVSNEKLDLQYDQNYMDEMYGLFSSQTFPIEKGQILGYGRTLTIKTNQYQGLSSIMVLQTMKEDDENHPFIVSLDGPKIVVFANKAVSNNVQTLQSAKISLSGLVNATIAYPALQYVVEMMIKHPDDYKDFGWFVAIKNKVADIRQKKNEPPFDFGPDEFVESRDKTLCDFVWDLVSELLTDSYGQLMVTGFEKAGENAEEVN
jgi:hypothetical protein